MDGKEDIEQALELLKEHVTFDKDVKVRGKEGAGVGGLGEEEGSREAVCGRGMQGGQEGRSWTVNEDM